eukprot:TRINITY_DN404_c0_g1_i1.p1 TRINITY_DN404_c0_g1~~TRINITY_DN404_c0_g1_i1.p1  ORF type:complete len:183 (+),score=73.83 TRINITY_DN404_c0_g1_i1:52-549(+)
MAQWGRATLWDAAADGNLELCKKRLESAMVKINSKDAQGRTPLHEAARWNHAHVIDWLIENGAEIEIQTVDGSTALQIAAAHGQVTAIEMLLNKGAQIDSKNQNLDTPLMMASSRGHIPAINILLARGANKTLKNSSLKSAIDQACNAATAEILRGQTAPSLTRY